jgi:hypothetical protein
LRKIVGRLWIVGFFGVVAAANAQTPGAPSAAPVTKYDGTYAFVSATNVNDTYWTRVTNRIGQCWKIRDIGPLIIANGQAEYDSFRRDQPVNKGTVGLQGELIMRLVATPGHNASTDPPAVATAGRIDGTGIARVRLMGDRCNYDVVWQRISSPTVNPQFDGTYLLVSMTQVDRISQCGYRHPKSLIVTNGEARLPLFEGTVGSRGELAMREGPSGDERIISGTIDSSGTVRAREIGRGCAYDFVWQKVNE